MTKESRTIEELEQISLEKTDVPIINSNFWTYPSDGFCLKHCPSQAYNQLKDYRESSRVMIEKGRDTAIRIYWRKLQIARFSKGCSECEVRKKLVEPEDYLFPEMCLSVRP